jgi:hypothetical protein
VTHKIPKKSQTMLEITELLGIQDFPLLRGSSIPSAFFTSIAIEMGIPVVEGMPKMARKIIEASHLPWNDKFSSEVTPSGGGGTVTALGLLQVKNAVLVWLGQPTLPLPSEVVFDDWAPNTHWKDLRVALPKEFREITTRPGANEFREIVLSEYDFKCAITGISTTEAIEVAHIVPYFGPESDELQNALPLRVDIHRLFDRGLIRVVYDHSSRKFKTEVHDSIMSDYSSLVDRPLSVPKDPLSAPSKIALNEQHKLFSEMWTVI